MTVCVSVPFLPVCFFVPPWVLVVECNAASFCSRTNSFFSLESDPFTPPPDAVPEDSTASDDSIATTSFPIFSFMVVALGTPAIPALT